MNLAAAEVVCHNCVNSAQPICANCGEKKVYFFGVDALDEFAKWLFDGRKGEWTAFAHNFSGILSYTLYDAYIYYRLTVCNM